jgi:hypothetical protein
MRKIVTAFFLILVLAAFAAFTVFILLYAQGKTFDGSTGIVQTGIIRVNSNPKDVSVYINEEERFLVESKIDALQPGKVSLTLRKDGYYDWTKEVLVEAGVLKDIFVQMIPKTIELSDVSTDDIKLFIPSNINEYIYYVSTDTLTDESVLKKIKVRRDFLDFSNATPTTIKVLEPSEYELLSTSEILDVSNDNTKLLFANNPLNTTGVIDLGNGIVENISSDLPTKVNKELSWFRNSNSILVTSESNLTYEYVLRTDLSLIVSNEPVSIHKAGHYVVFKDSEKVSLYENERIVPVSTNSNIVAQVLGAKDVIVNQLTSEQFSIVDPSGIITLYDTDKNLSIASNIAGDILYSSDDATHFIVKTDAGVYSVAFEYSIATRQYKLSEGALLTNGLSPSDVLTYKFYNNNKNILYSTKSQIFTSDLDGANFREITIPEGYEVVEANITTDNQFIYTILKDTETGLIKIYRINILLK